MNKVVINLGTEFGLSRRAEDLLEKQVGKTLEWSFDVFHRIPRHHPDLIAVVEALGIEVNSSRKNCDLRIIAVQEDKYKIVYDRHGRERIMTPKRAYWTSFDNITRDFNF